MAKRCYYEILGLSRGASEQDLKSAYRKLAKDCHPDANGGDKDAEQKFKELSEAYEILKDPQKRAAYDHMGHAAFEGQGRGHGFGPDFASSMSDIFDDLFGEFMGGRRGRQRSGGRERGADLRYNMDIALPEAYAGKTAQIRVPTSVTCTTCTGTGAKVGTRPTACATCGGHGKVRATPGLLHHRAHVPRLSGPRRDHQRSLRVLQRLGPGGEGAHALGEHSRGRGGRHQDQARRRRRGGLARRTGRRSLHFPVDQAARVLSARWRRHLLPRADLDDDCGAGRADRRALHRRREDRA